METTREQDNRMEALSGEYRSVALLRTDRDDVVGLLAVVRCFENFETGQTRDLILDEAGNTRLIRRRTSDDVTCADCGGDATTGDDWHDDPLCEGCIAAREEATIDAMVSQAEAIAEGDWR